MNTPMSVAVYFTMWWIVLFAVLPFGVRSQEEAGDVAEGTESAAPTAPRMLIKVVATTLISAVLFGLFTLYVNRMSAS